MLLLAVYELYMSVVKRRKGYTYDLYTALKHKGLHDAEKLAVGVTDGLVHLGFFSNRFEVFSGIMQSLGTPANHETHGLCQETVS